MKIHHVELTFKKLVNTYLVINNSNVIHDYMNLKKCRHFKLMSSRSCIFQRMLVFTRLWQLNCRHNCRGSQSVDELPLSYNHRLCCLVIAALMFCNLAHIYIYILTTNLAECVCVCAKCEPFLPLRFHFFFKLPEFFFRIAKFPYAAFGPLFAFHCPIFFTKNNTLNGVCMLNVTAAH